MAAGSRAVNDWAIEFQRVSPRYVCTATIPLLAIDDAVAEIERAAELGFKAAFFSVAPPPGQVPYQHADWDPAWAALEAAGMVLSFHIGTEPHEADTTNGVYYRGPGGAVLNYYETTFGGQRATAQLIASGALERHPGLKVMISEGGATWGPFLADRLDEGYRQHLSVVRPKLSKLPSEYFYSQVYASFQHDRSAVAACTAMGWRNVCWGSDYPHIEGTFGHSQKTLHELFDGVDTVDARRITVGAFQEMFPHIPDAPA
jgi:predicted TIM-barrel fold metal-dependent hydrolase